MLQILLDLVCQLLKEECWSFNYNHRFYYLFIQFYIIYLSLFLDSWSEVKWKLCLTQSDTVVSDSLWSLGLYVQWNSLQQNTGGGSLSHLQGIFPTQGFSDVYTLVLGFPGGSGVKNPLPMQEMRVWFLVQEDPLEKEMKTHSSILSWEIPWTGEPVGLQSIGSQKVGHDLGTKITTLLFSTAT